MKGEGSKRSDKRQTDILVGIALLLISVVFAFVAFSQPRVSNDYTQKDETSAVYSPVFTDEEEESQGETVISQTENTTAKNENSAADTEEKEAINVQYPLNLNTCTAEELMTIDNIGEARASAIIAYRDYLGGYTSVEQLKDISGIGDAVYASIEPYVTV
uniref:ComEA family DNA-binding protein n=1 Tax=Eubacterium sp. TaxID=142586 RepID=UPI004027B251